MGFFLRSLRSAVSSPQHVQQASRLSPRQSICTSTALANKYRRQTGGSALADQMNPMQHAPALSTLLQPPAKAVRAFTTGRSASRVVRTCSTARRGAADSLPALNKRGFLGLLGGATMWLSGSRGTATAAALTAEQVLYETPTYLPYVADSFTDFLKLAFLAGMGLLARGLSFKTPEQVLQEARWPAEFPFKADAFERYDESVDAIFYDQPRFVTHIDDGAINALTKFYSENFPPAGNKDVALLDVCSSWISHYPQGYSAGRIAGLGMSEPELARNKVLTEFAVKDLNKDPTLPYEDDAFDVITNAVSVDYLTKPLEVFKEMHRVLKPGGLAIMSFSNRCFPTKGDLDHILIVGSYFHYAGGYTPPEARDISPPPGLFGPKGDPMYVVYARKQAA